MTKRALLAAAVLGVAWGPCPAAQTCGARWYRGADPIGGGPGYTRMADPASARRVATLEELQAALSAARPGDTVYIDDRAEIDATGSPMMEIPAGVTLAGGRGAERFAGDWVVICHNTFSSYRPRIYTVIRGRPRQHVTIFANEYHNALHGARFSEPCDNAVIFGDCFERPPEREPYFFTAGGNRVNGKPQPPTAR